MIDRFQAKGRQMNTQAIGLASNLCHTPTTRTIEERERSQLLHTTTRTRDPRRDGFAINNRSSSLVVMGDPSRRESCKGANGYLAMQRDARSIASWQLRFSKEGQCFVYRTVEDSNQRALSFHIGEPRGTPMTSTISIYVPRYLCRIWPVRFA